MGSVDASVLLAFVAGIAGTIAAFAGKYAFDFRLAKRRLELDERGAIAATLGGGPGQLRRSALRTKDRVDGLFRDWKSLPQWLAMGDTPEADGYYLRSSVQRIFNLVAWGAVLQQSLDALPPETLDARRDLQRQYALVELSVSVLTNISMFSDFPGYVSDREGFHLFTGTVDELADLGVATYNERSNTIPHAVFAQAYTKDRALLQVRWWLSEGRKAGQGDARSVAVMARMACLGAVADSLTRPERDESFVQRAVLKARLEVLDEHTTYTLTESLPGWLDAELAGILRRWRR